MHEVGDHRPGLPMHDKKHDKKKEYLTVCVYAVYMQGELYDVGEDI